MGLEMLPEELVLMLREQWPCREAQIRQLSAVFSPHLPSPPTTVVHGAHSTAKSGLVKSYLERSELRHVIVSCRECVTGRHLLERTVAAVSGSLSDDGAKTIANERCENLSTLTAQLQRLLRGIDKYILVFDGIDRQREPPPTLLPALARLGENVPGLTTVLIVNHSGPRFLHASGVPHVHFPPYSRNQSIHILSREALDIFTGEFPPELDYDDDTHAEDKAWLWPRFCAAVFDSLGQSCARDYASFRSVCHKLWPTFVSPIRKGDFGTRDFSRLLVAQRKLFQEESVLLDSILSPSAAVATTKRSRAYNLPYYAKYILIAAYLCSSNPARLDQLYFSQTSERKRRKKGGGTARSGGGKPSQQRKLPRHLLAPSAFPLDRLLAVLHAILPHDVRTSIDVYAQIATLASLRLLVRAGGFGGGDPLEAGGKWKVGPAVSWDFVKGLAGSVDFALSDYLAE
ncbi:hypothetical protein B0A48_18419 [Cryoendolithus antarcticus]|uniref:Uncharacterized protein n=1 Tax=Cryoendolithus antarcticus TaxID=1507870 RepID=A0A1V8S8T3_9PEZI|nr:hypothetical protein B0A48_18419 [Cryoendolithus antarcticus]